MVKDQKRVIKVVVILVQKNWIRSRIQNIRQRKQERGPVIAKVLTVGWLRERVKPIALIKTSLKRILHHLIKNQPISQM